MTYVREVTETDLYNSMCLYFQFDSIWLFSEMFELVSLLSKQFHAFKAYILLLHVFSLRVTLTPVRVTHFTYSLPTISLEPIVGLSQNLHGYVTGAYSLLYRMHPIQYWFYDPVVSLPM